MRGEQRERDCADDEHGRRAHRHPLAGKARGEREPQSADRRQRQPIDRDGVAGRAHPVIRPDDDEKRRDRACREREPVVRRRARALCDQSRSAPRTPPRTPSDTAGIRARSRAQARSRRPPPMRPSARGRTTRSRRRRAGSARSAHCDDRCGRGGTDETPAARPRPCSSATSAASRPAMRHAIAAVPAIAGRSHSIGHAPRISRSAIAGSANQPKIHSVPASPRSISRDQCDS